jgi:hypothetical protein
MPVAGQPIHGHPCGRGTSGYRHNGGLLHFGKQQVPDLTRVHVYSNIHCQAGVSSYVGDSQMITDCV